MSKTICGYSIKIDVLPLAHVIYYYTKNKERTKKVEVKIPTCHVYMLRRILSKNWCATTLYSADILFKRRTNMFGHSICWGLLRMKISENEYRQLSGLDVLKKQSYITMLKQKQRKDKKNPSTPLTSGVSRSRPLSPGLISCILVHHPPIIFPY